MYMYVHAYEYLFSSGGAEDASFALFGDGELGRGGELDPATDAFMYVCMCVCVYVCVFVTFWRG